MLLSTTTITVERADETGDPYESAIPVTVATRVPAHIEVAAVRIAQLEAGATQPLNAIMLLDPTPVLQQHDIVTDDLTGIVYQVDWVRARTGLGLDHQRCGVFSRPVT